MAGASGQLRNKATTAGNLLQRTRCPYFYDTNQPCNKRQPGSGCSAIGGIRDSSPSSGQAMPVSLRIRATWQSPCGLWTLTIETVKERWHRRSIPIADFHRLPGDTPEIETVLEPGEFIIAVMLPPRSEASISIERFETAPPTHSPWFPSVQ